MDRSGVVNNFIVNLVIETDIVNLLKRERIDGDEVGKLIMMELRMVQGAMDGSHVEGVRGVGPTVILGILHSNFQWRDR